MTGEHRDHGSPRPRMQRYYHGHRGPVAVLGAVALVAGIILLAMSLPDLRVLPLTLGAIATAFGVLVVVDYLVHRHWRTLNAPADHGVPRVAWWMVVIGMAGLGVAAVIIWVAEDWEVAWLAAVGVAVGVLGVGVLSVVANRLSSFGAPVWMVVGLALSVVGPVLALVIDADWTWIVAVLGLVLGLMAFQLGLRSVLDGMDPGERST